MLLLGACGGGEVAPAPTEEELAIFTEIVLIEAVLQDYTGLTKDTLSERYYTRLYDRYGLDAQQLDGLRDRYNQDPRLWIGMADSVEARLNRAQADPSALLNRELN